MGVIVLCADTESLQHPALIGLEDVCFEGLPWLLTFANAHKAREFVKKSDEVDEVWVVSSDDISPINLAAAIKHDNANQNVYLITFEPTGSLVSCMKAAGITATFTQKGFVARFALEKQQRSCRESLKGTPSDTTNTASENAESADIAHNGQITSSSRAFYPDTTAMYDQINPGAANQQNASVNAEKNKPQDCREDSAGTVAGSGECENADTNANTNTATNTDATATADTTTNTNATATADTVTNTDATVNADANMDATAHADAVANTNAYATENANITTNAVSTASDAGVSAHNAMPETQIPYADNVRERRQGGGFVLSVLSGSGGVGKSTVAALSAFCAQKHGYRCVLLDCDLQFGDLHYFMGVDSPVRVEDVFNDTSIIQTLESQEDVPALVASLQRMEDAETFSRMLPQVIEALSAQFDVVVVNTGANWAEHHAVILECSTCALFLVDQRASSVRACRRALDLCRRCGIASGSFAYAINHCSRGSLLTSVDVSCALQGVHVHELKDGGTLVEELLGTGMALELVGQRNDLCSSIDKMLGEILPQERLSRFESAADYQRESKRYTKRSSRKSRNLQSSRKRFRFNQGNKDVLNNIANNNMESEYVNASSVVDS